MIENAYLSLPDYYRRLMEGVRVNDGQLWVEPYQVIVNVTMRCNSRCPYCDVWQKRIDGPPLADWQRALDDLHALGAREFIITGGEPLLRGDIDAWIREATRRSMYTVLITNGLLLTEKRIQQLLAVNTHRITLSFDSFDEEHFVAQRGVPIKRPLAALDALAHTLRSQPPPWFSVGINVVATARNIHDIPAIVRYAAENRMSVQIQTLNAYPGLNVGYFLPAPEEMDDFRAGIATLIRMKEEGYPINSSAEYLRYSPEYLTSQQLPANHHCLMADVSVILDEHFDLLPCWFLPPVGNVLQTPVADLWTSPQMAEARRDMHRGKCPGCWLTCNADWEISFLGKRK